MLGEMKRGLTFSLSEMTAHMRALHNCNFPAVVVCVDGSIRVTDLIDNRVIASYSNAEDYLREVRK